MVEIISNLRKTKKEFINYCYILTKKLIEREFKELKSYDFIIRWVFLKESDKTVAAIHDWTDDKRHKALYSKINQKSFTIWLNSRHAKDMGDWSEKKTLDLLRHELIHVSMKKGDSDPLFKKELQKRKVSATLFSRLGSHLFVWRRLAH